jgi:hypothetical protein
VSNQHDDWSPQLEPINGDQFKWGLNGSTGELTIWEVGGPGDGFPSHQDELAAAWGRESLHQSGDILGSLTVGKAELTIVAYERSDAPREVLLWALTHFPAHAVNVSRR